MNRRKYTNDPSILLKEGKEIMLSHDDTRFYFRVFSVNFVSASAFTAFMNRSSFSLSSAIKNTSFPDQRSDF